VDAADSQAGGLRRKGQGAAPASRHGTVLHPCCARHAMQVVLKSQILAGGRGLGTFTNGLKASHHVTASSSIAIV
jgi:hypothetical protein